MLDRVQARLRRRSGPVLFAFSGLWGASTGMGRGLYATEPAFRASIDGCDPVAREWGVHVSEAFCGQGLARPADPRVRRRMQMVHLGVLQLALCDLWADAGVEPDATLSLSLGEPPAAYAARALNRDEAVAIICSVSGVLTTRQREGVYFTLATDLGTARDLCREAPRQLDLLGTLDPVRAMVYSRLDDAEENGAFLEDACRVTARHQSSWAYHTTEVSDTRQVLEGELAHLEPREPQIPVYSAISGRDIARDAVFDALHWQWLIAQPFYYGEAIHAALRSEPGVIVNIGADPFSTPCILAAARQREMRPRIVDSMRRGDDGRAWAHARAAVSRRGRHSVRVTAAPDSTNLDPEMLRDPHPHFERLRRRGPVHSVPGSDTWLVVGYEEVREAFGRPAVFSSQPMADIDSSLLGADPPDHTVARRALAARFGPEALAELRTLAEQTCHELLAARAGASEFDVVGEYAAPLGERIGARVMGLDDVQLERMRRLAGDPERPSSALIAPVAAALAEILPGSTSLDRLLWLASTSTTKRVIASAVLLVLRDPVLRARLVHDPSVIGAFIHETIRLHPPERVLKRFTTARVTLGGASIPAASVVSLCVAAANRDPAHFEDPDQVRLDRRVIHLGFGAGGHRCIGARLGRIEAEVALNALLQRMPDFRSVQPACALRWIPSATNDGVERLLIAA